MENELIIHIHGYGESKWIDGEITCTYICGGGHDSDTLYGWRYTNNSGVEQFKLNIGNLFFTTKIKGLHDEVNDFIGTDIYIILSK